MRDRAVLPGNTNDGSEARPTPAQERCSRSWRALGIKNAISLSARAWRILHQVVSKCGDESYRPDDLIFFDAAPSEQPRGGGLTKVPKSEAEANARALGELFAGRLLTIEVGELQGSDAPAADAPAGWFAGGEFDEKAFGYGLGQESPVVPIASLVPTEVGYSLVWLDWD